MLIHELAPESQTIPMRCLCGETFRTNNLHDESGKLQGSAWCISCDAVFRKSEGLRRYLESQEVITFESTQEVEGVSHAA